MLNNIAFTICSINYLAQAITLGKSLNETNPDVHFRVYLVDKFEGREYLKTKIPFPVVEIGDIPITDFEGMCVRYNITELNTAVKPFIFDHILNTEENVANVIYFDPDIKVFGSLKELRQRLITNTLVLTPHILSPCDESPFGVSEKSFLETGVYNLGFIAVSRQNETFRFLNWWKSRLVNQAYASGAMHLFYDQKWLVLAPVFFKNVYIEMSPGYNMAGWNLYERWITSQKDNQLIINKDFELVFYHFSGVRINAENISNYTTYSFSERPDLKDIVNGYRKDVLNNGCNLFTSYSCYYTQFYKGIITYYPAYHWITIYRRTRFYLGKYKQLLFGKKVTT